MEELSNLTHEEVQKLIVDFPIKPLRNKLVISVNVDEVGDDVMLQNSSFAETQYVIATGGFSNGIEPGQKILLDLEKMTEYSEADTNTYERISRIKLKPIEVDGRMFALITDHVVDAIDER